MFRVGIIGVCVFVPDVVQHVWLGRRVRYYDVGQLRIFQLGETMELYGTLFICLGFSGEG